MECEKLNLTFAEVAEGSTTKDPIFNAEEVAFEPSELILGEFSEFEVIKAEESKLVLKLLISLPLQFWKEA